MLIGLMVLVLNAINTTGEFLLARIVNAHAAAVAAGAPDPLAVRQRVIGAFYGDYQTWVSTATALLQIFLVARLFRAVGVRGSLYVLPVLALCGYGAFALAPLLVVAAAVKVAENGGGYSLQNTAQQALFLPTSRDAKYKAKAATDTFFVRFGDLASTALVFVGVQAGLGVRGYSLANAALAAVWLALVARLARRHRGLARGGRLERGAPLPRTH